MRTLKYKSIDGTVITAEGKEFVKTDPNGNDIYEGDTVFDYLGNNHIIIWDDLTCSYRLKSSEVYGGSKAITGTITLADPKHVFKEPGTTNERSRTPTSDRLSSKASSNALKGIGLR